MRSRLFVLCVIAALSHSGPTPASAQATGGKDDLGSPFGWSQEVRTVVTFKIPDETAQRLLPAGWTVAPVQQGPAKGANLTIVFAERMATLDASGKAVGGEEVGAILSIPSRKGQDMAAAIIDGYSDPQTAPGYYRVNKPAKIALDRVSRAANLSSSVEETWTVMADDGGRIAFRVAYEQAAPVRTQLVVRNVSATDAAVRRNYQVDQGLNVILSEPNGVKRAKDVSFTATGGTLGALFDGKTEMVSVVSLPWYSRQMFVPTATD